MASTNKTSKLKLPKWLAGDKPERTDFNDMSDKIILI